MIDRNRIYPGDTLAVLRTWPDAFVDCIVTSPPYWGLRSYLPDGHEDKSLEQGLEKTPDEYIARMTEVFRECRRVLKPQGTCWVNMGDSYASAPAGNFGKEMPKPGEGGAYKENKPKMNYSDCGLKPKDLCGIPWRLAFALQADGWWLRQDIIWHKPNPMPESVTDRCTKAHEYIFMLTKSAKYFYDAEAIKEPAISTDLKKFTDGGRDKQRGHGRRHAGFNGRYAAQLQESGCPKTRNRRSVWTVATHAFPEAHHFATFPPALIDPMVKAGCPAQVCPKCGKGRERILENGFTDHTGETETAYDEKSTAGRLAKLRQAARENGGEYQSGKKQTGLTDCGCNAGWKPGLVLDPFMGAGTTALVAYRNRRDYLGIELNPEYIKMAEKRLDAERDKTPLLAGQGGKPE